MSCEICARARESLPRDQYTAGVWCLRCSPKTDDGTLLPIYHTMRHWEVLRDDINRITVALHQYQDYKGLLAAVQLTREQAKQLRKALKRATRESIRVEKEWRDT